MIRVLRDMDMAGALHMERDMAMLADDTITLRLYTWTPWAVSLGYNQDAAHLDDRAIADRGWQIVRRPTGGRAVLHAEELTYGIVVPLRDGHTPSAVYSAVHDLLLDALGTIAPSLAFTSVGANLNHHYATQGAVAMSCFTASARTEIHAGGRKVVGSAQRKLGSAVLQHGSILTGPAHRRITEVITAGATERMALDQRLLASSISLSELAGSTVTAHAVADAIEQAVPRHTSNITGVPRR